MSISWSVGVGLTGLEVPLVSVQSVGMDVGTTQITDQLRAGTCTITGRVPGSQPPIAVGDRILITASTSLGNVYWVFRVRNYVIDYAEVAAADTWTLTGEDVFAYLGRATGDVSWSAGDRTDVAAVAICTMGGASTNVATVGKSTVSAQTLTNVNALAELTKIVNTEQAADRKSVV